MLIKIIQHLLSYLGALSSNNKHVMSNFSKWPIFDPNQDDTFRVICVFIILAISALLYSVIFIKINIQIQAAFLFGGFIFFTLTEYLIHRFLLHLKGETGGQKWKSNSHTHHHEFPLDKNRIDITLPLAMILAALFFLVFWVLLKKYAFLFFSGFIAGYTLYHFVHYKIHTSRPPKNILKYLWQHHHIHHHINESLAFGVTSPFWDIIFGTMPKETKNK